MNYKYQINTPTPEHFKKLIKCLFSLGYKFDSFDSANDLSKRHPYCYEWIIIADESNKSMSGNHSSRMDYKTITFDEFLALEEPLIIKVKLNDGHTALVSKDGIKVGCQTFPLSIATELVAAVVQVKLGLK